MDKRSFDELYETIVDEIKKYFSKRASGYKERIEKAVKEVENKYVNELVENILERPHKVKVYYDFKTISGIYTKVPTQVVISAELPMEVEMEIGEKIKEISEEMRKINNERSKAFEEAKRWYLMSLATGSYKNPRIPKSIAKYLPPEYDVIVEKD